MIWLGLLCVVAIVFFLRSRYSEEEEEIQVPAAAAATTESDLIAEAEDCDELLAVITAAIAELEGSGNFQVMSVTARTNSNWLISARQETVFNRL